MAKADTAFQGAFVGQPTEPCLGKLGYGGTDIDLLGAEGDPVRLKALVEQLGAQRPVVIIAITSPAAIALSEMAVSADCTRCHLQELTANASSLPPVNSDDSYQRLAGTS